MERESNHVIGKLYNSRSLFFYDILIFDELGMNYDDERTHR